MFEVYFSNKARKQFRNLELSFKQNVSIAVKLLALEPFPSKQYDIKKIQGIKDCYRIRLGRFRLIYNVNTSAKEILIIKIEKRESVYD